MSTKIKTADLIQLVDGLKELTYVTVAYRGPANLKRTGCPYDSQTTKQTVITGAILYDYQKSVRDRQEAEDKKVDFVAKPRAWGERHGNWVTHKGNHYLPIRVEHLSEKTFFSSTGAVIPNDLVQPFLREPSEAKSQGDLVEKVVIRDYNLEHIFQITINGDVYDVIH